MFIVKEKEVNNPKLIKIFKLVQAIYGTIPPQIKFLSAFGDEYVEAFLTNLSKVLKHPHIERDIFSFVRLFIAYKENYPFCKSFNTTLLLDQGYSQELLDDVIQDIQNIPFGERQKSLASFAIKAIYHPFECKESDFNTLLQLSWSQNDIFDLISHAGDILKNGRILTAYLRGKS